MKDKKKYIVGTWYKDRDGDFIKFYKFDIHGDFAFTANFRAGEYELHTSTWFKSAFPKCIPMTTDEMKLYLPEHEWWIKPSNELFPIY